MSDVCRRAATEYPNKRLIFHYIQPHAPYLGSTADQIRAEFEIAGWNPEHISDGVPEERDRPLIWDLARDSKIEWETVRTAYGETLERTLSSVRELVDDLEGRIVISADHGELLGERLIPGGPREWAHPEGLAVPSLRVVPWHVIQDKNRPRIVSDPPKHRTELSETEVNNRLNALGYVSGEMS